MSTPAILNNEFQNHILKITATLTLNLLMLEPNIMAYLVNIIPADALVT